VRETGQLIILASAGYSKSPRPYIKQFWMAHSSPYIAKVERHVICYMNRNGRQAPDNRDAH
jgi:hypothetical protein